MIITNNFFIEYYSKFKKFQSFYGDETLPNDLLFQDIWKKILKTKKRVLCFAQIDFAAYPKEDLENSCYEKMKAALEKDKNSPVIIFLTGQEVNQKFFETLITSSSRKVFFINDYGYSDSTHYSVQTSHRAWKGYINNVPFIPHNDRPYTITALSNRFEVFRWLFIAKLSLCKINSCITFHNHDNIDGQSFFNLCQSEMAMTPNWDIMAKIEELLKSAPIRPDFITDPWARGFYNQWQQTDLSLHVRSRLNLTLEGSYIDRGKGVNLTEKTGKCLASGTFPLHIGQSGGFDRLRSWGFEGFENNGKFNLDYDKLEPDFLSANFRSKKVEKIFKMLESLDDNIDVEGICKKNYEWFHNGWYDHCEKQNEIEIDRLRSNL